MMMEAYKNPTDRLRYIFEDHPECGEEKYIVLKPNGRKKFVPLVIDGMDRPPIVEKTRKNKTYLEIQYWRSCELEQYMRECFGIREGDPVGPVLREMGILRYLGKMTVESLRYILEYLFSLRPSNLVCAQRALHGLAANEHMLDLHARIRGSESYRDYSAWTSELVKMGIFYNSMMRTR